MTEIKLNDAQLEAIHGGMGVEDEGDRHTRDDAGIGKGNLGGGGIDTETLQQSRDLPGA